MRIGPQMQYAANIVAENPGCSKRYVAEILANSTRLRFIPGGLSRSNHIGYDPVNRAIKAGLIRAEKINESRYALYPPLAKKEEAC